MALRDVEFWTGRQVIGTSVTIYPVIRLKELQSCDLIFMTPKPEKSNLRYQIPKDNIRVLGSACETDTIFIET